LRTSWLIVGMKPFTFFSYFTGIPASCADDGGFRQTAKAPAGISPLEPQEHPAMFSSNVAQPI